MDIEIELVVFTSADEIIIHYTNYGKANRNYGELFNFLGDYDVVTASELGKNVIISSGDVYFFTLENEEELRINSEVTIKKHCLLEEFVDYSNPDHLSFLNWYNNN